MTPARGQGRLLRREALRVEIGPADRSDDGDPSAVGGRRLVRAVSMAPASDTRRIRIRPVADHDIEQDDRGGRVRGCA